MREREREREREPAWEFTLEFENWRERGSTAEILKKKKEKKKKDIYKKI